MTAKLSYYASRAFLADCMRAQAEVEKARDIVKWLDPNIAP